MDGIRPMAERVQKTAQEQDEFFKAALYTALERCVILIIFNINGLFQIMRSHSLTSLLLFGCSPVAQLDSAWVK